MKQIIVIITILLYSSIARAQSDEYYFKNYQESEDLASSTITAITQDLKGFMWFGTRNGLYRFDGNNFKTFRNELLNKKSIGSNSILSIYEDKNGFIWVGTYTGIYIYNPQSEDFIHLKALPSGEVRFIYGNKDFTWIVSGSKLYRFSYKSNKISYFNFSNSQVVSLALSESKYIWVATNMGHLKQFSISGKYIRDFYLPEIKQSAINPINALFVKNRDTIILGTTSEALFFNPQTAKISVVKNENKKIYIHTVVSFNKKELWFGTEEGIFVYNTSTGKSNVISKEANDPYALTDNIISTIYKDKEGGVWIGTYFGGINYYSQQFNNFRKYFPKQKKNSISGVLVHEIVKDNIGKLWIGTEDAGLNSLDPKTGNLETFLPENKKGSLSYHNIHGLLVDGDKLWIGTYEHGLDVMDLTTKKVIRHYIAGNNATSFSSDFIITLYKTKSNDILIGTWNGLFKYNRVKDSFSPLPFFRDHIQSIKEDASGTLWVGTYGNGVFFKNFKTNRTGTLNSVSGLGLINNYVNNVFIDSKNILWFCTEEGLSQYNPVTKKFVNFTKDDGLPANQVFKILEDNDGIYWVSTSKGLAKFNSIKREFTNYHTSHGLSTEQFNYNSAYKDTDGTLYFGTVKGLISFNPKKFKANNYVPPVYITNLQLNSKDVSSSSENTPLVKSIIATKNIELPYNRSNINLEVAVLSYVFPDMNRYMYKLEGLDQKWIELNKNHKVYFTQLPPGNYKFVVKGSNSDGVWNNLGASLRIKITPPYWATTWAYFFYIVVVLSIITVIFWYYRLFLREKSKRYIEIIEISKEREVYNAKIDFFTNLAHEIRTPLTLIRMPLDKLLSIQKEDKETIETLNIMKKNTNRLIDLTNQLLDFRKAEANNFSLNFSETNINETVSEVFGSFRPAAEQKNLDYKLILPQVTLNAFVDIDAFKKILFNLTSNAIKYSNKSVKIKLLPFSSEDDIFTVEFRNDGHVISDKHASKIFEPFFRIENTNTETGTGIGLPLSKSLAELHKGFITLEKTDDESNLFVLRLPIHQDFEFFLSRDKIENDDETIVVDNSLFDKINDGSKPTVLLVEDNHDVLSYLYKEMSQYYNLYTAINGQEGFDLVQHQDVQVIVSDIMMPVMDGITFCKKIKQEIESSHIPFILLTAKNSLGSKVEGLEAGADAYIEKPFSLEYLVAQINSLLTNRNNIKDHFSRRPLTHLGGIGYSKTDKDFLEKLNHVIYQNITNIDLDVDHLSSLMNVSRPTLYRKIKGLSDLTPHELINLTRLKRGAELLASGDFKINEVANLVGYSLPTNFSRDFQKQFGISPSSYMNTLKKKG